MNSINNFNKNSNNEFINYKGFNNINKSNNHVYMESSKKCSNICDLDKNCVAIEFNLKTKKCDLFDELENKSSNINMNLTDNQDYLFKIKKNKIMNDDNLYNIHNNNSCINTNIFDKSNNFKDSLGITELENNENVGIIINEKPICVNSDDVDSDFLFSKNTKQIIIPHKNDCWENDINDNKIKMNKCQDNNSKQKFIYDEKSQYLRIYDEPNKCVGVNINEKGNASLNVGKCKKTLNNKITLDKKEFDKKEFDINNNIKEYFFSDDMGYNHKILITIILLIIIIFLLKVI